MELYASQNAPSIIMPGQKTQNPLIPVFKEFAIDSSVICFFLIMVYLYYGISDKKEHSGARLAVALAVFETIYVFFAGFVFSFSPVSFQVILSRFLFIPYNLFINYIYALGLFFFFKNKIDTKLVLSSIGALFLIRGFAVTITGFGPLNAENISGEFLSFAIYSLNALFMLGLFEELKRFIKFKMPEIFFFLGLGAILTLLSWTPVLIAYFLFFPNITTLLTYGLFGVFLHYSKPLLMGIKQQSL
ncbi:MAG: hypothetical protein V1859_07565 [archaeon]